MGSKLQPVTVLASLAWHHISLGRDAGHKGEEHQQLGKDREGKSACMSFASCPYKPFYTALLLETMLIDAHD